MNPDDAKMEQILQMGRANERRNRIVFWVFTISAFVLGWLAFGWIHG
jgi:hypothetical protein